MATSVGIPNPTGECRDYTGRSIQHAMHFVPPGVDMCKLCICENGHAKVSSTFFFTPERLRKLKNYKLLYRRVERSSVHLRLNANPFKWAHHAVNLSVWTIR